MKRLHIPLILCSGIILSSLASAAPPIIADAKIPEVKAEDLIPHLTPMKGTTPCQWRVTWTGDASTEATVSWTTREEGSKHRLLYGTDPSKLDQVMECQVNKGYRYGSKPGQVRDAFYHHARLSDLQPDTNYHFVMESDGERSKPLYFRTAPASGTGFSIIHGGDSRSGHTDRCRMNLLIAAMTRDHKEILAFAHGGDYIKQGQSWDQWRLWLSQHELTTAPDGRVLPIIPTRGNHDGGRHYAQIFDLEDREGAWFVTKLGKDVALVTLNTGASASEQAEWLESQLSELRPKTRWLMVQYHRPMYPAIKGPARQAPIFCPLFEKYNIDIALESDGHCMKRTVPIRDGKKDPTGIIYVGEGGLGVKQKKPSGKQWYLQDGGKHGFGHHIMRLDFTDETLRTRFIRMNGQVWDDFTIKAR